jgi:hypothetical protein
MEPERRQQGEGRRTNDAWLSRIVNLFAIVAAFSTVAFYGVPMLGVPARVDALEKDQQDRRETDPVMLLMTCGLYRKAYPDQVPALCDKAISRSRPQ